MDINQRACCAGNGFQVGTFAHMHAQTQPKHNPTHRCAPPSMHTYWLYLQASPNLHVPSFCHEKQAWQRLRQ